MTCNPDLVYILSHPDWWFIDTDNEEYAAIDTAPVDYKEAVSRYNAYIKARQPDEFEK